jgi:polyhydroxyalkanoate synthase
LLHRLVQGYLAASRTAETLVDDAGLDWRDDRRVRFLADNLIEALSPSNIPMVNPASAGSGRGWPPHCTSCRSWWPGT